MGVREHKKIPGSLKRGGESETWRERAYTEGAGEQVSVWEPLGGGKMCLGVVPTAE